MFKVKLLRMNGFMMMSFVNTVDKTILLLINLPHGADSFFKS